LKSRPRFALWLSRRSSGKITNAYPPRNASSAFRDFPLNLGVRLLDKRNAFGWMQWLKDEEQYKQKPEPIYSKKLNLGAPFVVTMMSAISKFITLMKILRITDSKIF
jgi:hypothetical protein